MDCPLSLVLQPSGIMECSDVYLSGPPLELAKEIMELVIYMSKLPRMDDTNTESSFHLVPCVYPTACKYDEKSVGAGEVAVSVKERIYDPTDEDRCRRRVAETLAGSIGIHAAFLFLRALMTTLDWREAPDAVPLARYIADAATQPELDEWSRRAIARVAQGT